MARIAFSKVAGSGFSAITVNWRGRPLTSYEVIVETIGAVTTKTGLTVEARLDLGSYPKGITISDKDMAVFEKTLLNRHTFHPDWNYTVLTAPRTDTTRPNSGK
jgi:hypothetical protein